MRGEKGGQERRQDEAGDEAGSRQRAERVSVVRWCWQSAGSRAGRAPEPAKLSATCRRGRAAGVPRGAPRPGEYLV